MTAVPAPAPLLARRPRLVAAAAAALAATAGLAWLGGEDDPGSRTLATGSFVLGVPEAWRAATPETLASAPGRPAALLRRSDGRGAVTVHERPRLDGSLASVERSLDRRIARELPGAERIAARTVGLATGPALSYTFVDRRSGLVHGIVVAPSGARTLTIETAASGGAGVVAREIGAIVRSLRPAS